MILWIVFAVMTAVAVLAILAPLTKKRQETDASDANDVAVYKDQLKEVASDFERGLIAPVEADAARSEIARRLLKAAGETETESEQNPKGEGVSFGRKIGAAFAIACIPGFSLGLYLFTGAPDLPAQPFASRQPVQSPRSVAQEESTITLIARAEEHLRRNPTDIRGWRILAPIYTRMRRFNDATDAYRRIMALSGNAPREIADYGESLVIANRGLVSVEALDVFQKLRKKDPKMPRPQHYIALADAQSGNLKAAAEKWRALLASASGNVPWRADIERLAARAEGKEPPKTATSSLPAPQPAAPALPQGSRPPALDNEQMKAAGALDAKSRQEMIASMVKRLSDRLAEGGGSVGEWVRLARAYKVLGRDEPAKAALDKAEAAYAGKPEAIEQLQGARKQLGIDQ